MLDVEYLYLGGPFDGQWRRPMNVGLTPGAPGPQAYPDRTVLRRLDARRPRTAALPGQQPYPDSEGNRAGRYIPTKLGHMAMRGEGNFRIQCTVMLDEPWYELLTNQSKIVDQAELYRVKSLERALTMQAFREHLQRTWRIPEALDFGPAWLAMEQRPR